MSACHGSNTRQTDSANNRRPTKEISPVHVLRPYKSVVDDVRIHEHQAHMVEQLDF